VLYMSELLGHSSPAITQAVYQHVRTERVNGQTAGRQRPRECDWLSGLLCFRR
jgi:integrase